AVAAITVTCIYKIFPSITAIGNIFKKSGVTSGYFLTALKALGIAYISSFAADTCRDSGQTALAAKAEFAGKCAIFILTVPIILNVLEIALEFASL
ncbi:MAG: stage III sporulation protein AD, partial [Clostridia bacterium]|nr:stage III sporulation protein AD [Clostridia bacterium]